MAAAIEEQPKLNMPWVEKYRPQKLDDLISQDYIVNTIRKLISHKQLPHLLFYGPPGTGKTTTILACAKVLYTPAQFASMVLELNASDDRGIGTVRGAILDFASTKTMFQGGVKLIILDEADAMTHDAQNALRRIMEKYTANVRFCIICNYLGKIIPAIQSRCTKFRFAPLDSKEILPRLEYVIEQEKIKISDDGKQAVLTLGQGDMRKVLNILQSTFVSFSEVNEENVYTCVGHPLQCDIFEMLQSLLNDNLSDSYKKIQTIKTLKGLALSDIVTELHTWVHKLELPSKVVCLLLISLSDIEYNLNNGSSENIELGKLLSAFYKARTLSVDIAKTLEENF
ncbi:Replication factor C subunit, putative [Pediculus humanus corporis]|uniref:Activator 1 subunit 5 n=1 Tax=Pediculus humanus subsp. corporis TaxID=121224 RepID=E0VW40_PEDHC|nr:Replication factor C subunit, putative [Pediculus humanus corporis]EEB17596.1 Replication factor C subunit, putative [Pediculus humanus corporis]